MSDNFVPTRNAYRNLLTTLAARLPRGQFGLNFAVTGSKWNTKPDSQWNGELMVCGRAPNGIGKAHELLPEHLVTEDARIKRVESWEGLTEKHHELDWVANCWDAPTPDGYRTRSSAFWRVTRRVANQVCSAPFDDNAWSSTLAWINLYQVAPLAQGNPGMRLRRLLQADSVRLLESDVTRLGPKRLLVMAGYDWAAPFFTHDMEWHPNDTFVQGAGRWTLPNGQRVAVVVARHPQGKPEGPMVSAVVKAFETLGPA